MATIMATAMAAPDIMGMAMDIRMIIMTMATITAAIIPMAAMARMVTDRATFGWLCDVYVDQGHRGAGLGKAIVAYMKGHPDLQGFRRMHLATRDAHGLYAQFGFGPMTAVDRWMEIRDADVYKRAAGNPRPSTGSG